MVIYYVLRWNWSGTMLVSEHDVPMTLTLMAALADPSLFSRVTLYCPASPWILLPTSRWQEVYSFLFR